MNTQAEYKVPQVISNHKGKNRLLIITKPSEQILNDIKQSESELKERKLVFVNIPDSEESFIADRELSKKKRRRILGWLQQQEMTPLLTLVGLDGEIKYQQNLEEFDLKKVFEKIDKMPMRAAELQSEK